MAHYALIGKTLSHSYSKRYFDAFFDSEGLGHTYDLLEMDSLDDLGLAIEDKQLSGFNVTIPYKERILPMLSGLSEEAKAIGAVNVVSVKGKQLIGFNTDAPAFLETLRPLLRPHHTSALILGTGGASKAVAFALQKLGVDYHFVSRNPQADNQVSYREASARVRDTFLIVNATPLGTFPAVEGIPPLDLESVGERHLVYDLVYNPAQTRLLKAAAAQGAATKNGQSMLDRQAELAYRIWTNGE